MKKKSKFKVLKVIGIVVLVIISIGVGVLVYLDNHIESIVDNFIKNEYQGTKISKVYSIEYSNIKLSIFSGSIILEDVKIKPRESFYTANDSIRFNYPIVYDIEIPKFIVAGVSKDILLNLKKIQLEEIEFVRPSFTIIDHLSKNEKRLSRKYLSEKPKNDTSQGLDFDQFKLANFELNKGSFKYYSRLKQRELISAGKINVHIKNLDLSPDYVLKTLITNTFEAAYISLADISYPTADGFYKIQVGELKNNVGDQVIRLSDVELIPQYDKLDFGEKMGKQVDRMAIKLAALEISGFDFNEFIDDDIIHINNILISEMHLEAFRDKNVPFDLTKFPKSPQQALAGIKFKLNVEQITIEKSEALYEQLSVDAGKVGQVPVKNIEGTIMNITNMPAVIARKGPMKCKLGARLFDEGELDLEVVFSEDITKWDFKMKGAIGEMDMTSFNTMIEFAEFVRVDNGHIKSMSFEATANEEYSEGWFVLIYDSLKMTVMKKFQDKEKKELGFVSSLANTLIRKFNPPKNSPAEPDTASIFFVRDKNKGVLNYIIKSLLIGVKSTLVPGIGMNKKKYEKKQTKQEHKDVRLNKREQRKKDREDKKGKKSN